MPTIVLMAICIVVSGLLIFAYNLTYVDTTGVLTDDLKEGCEAVFGEGEYTIMTVTNDDGSLVPVAFEGAVSVIKDAQGNCLVEVIASGFEKDSIHLVVGFNKDGDDVKGVGLIKIADSPSQSAKVSEKGFLDSFIGLKTPDEISGVDVVSRATYSSKGIKSAVEAAVNVYNQNKEAIFSE
jgi:electron transport complex protein RnfG